ncbi:Hap5p SCDLUD_003351 [Saccharomycodes ludwigii]|uniref:Hap5p n=1 Tax=Saccharomycodes ludwigii TaxID=36035 RepID=UPI001E8497F3|nr:hypothetical protein SCDLUD_003351 [Saccharomycodes ludwigii]KAH3900376.1 hypothetical protein SCDLUD_003351 [Saccharomycodes ludwigii]
MDNINNAHLIRVNSGVEATEINNLPANSTTTNNIDTTIQDNVNDNNTLNLHESLIQNISSSATDNNIQASYPIQGGMENYNQNTFDKGERKTEGEKGKAEEEEEEEEEEILVEDEEDVFRNVAQGLEGKYRDLLIDFWQQLINQIESTNEPYTNIKNDFKSHSLPLARIKKVMKTDENVKMISAETPILFSQACEIFITELTVRAWCVADGDKRRTLQKQDVAEALQKSDMYDFLIDIVPRTFPK